MREKLASNIGKRHKYIATFTRNGMKNGYKGPIQTVLLSNICNSTGVVVADHIWMVKGKQIAKLNLKPGDSISFEGRVDEYEKGYKGQRDIDLAYIKPIETDYRIVYPTKFKIERRNVI